MIAVASLMLLTADSHKTIDAIKEPLFEADREKYNSSTIHVVDDFDAFIDDGRLNVFIDPNKKHIHIKDPYKLNAEERIVVLEYIMSHQYYKNGGFTRSLSSYDFEWWLHNCAYNLNFFRDNARSLDLNETDNIWNLYGFIKK